MWQPQPLACLAQDLPSLAGRLLLLVALTEAARKVREVQATWKLTAAALVRLHQRPQARELELELVAPATMVSVVLLSSETLLSMEEASGRPWVVGGRSLWRAQEAVVMAVASLTVPALFVVVLGLVVPMLMGAPIQV